MLTPIRAFVETLNPKGGNGMYETIIFLVVIAVLLCLNIMQIPVSSELQYVLYAIIGYMVGTNAKKTIDNSKEE